MESNNIQSLEQRLPSYYLNFQFPCSHNHPERRLKSITQVQNLISNTKTKINQFKNKNTGLNPKWFCPAPQPGTACNIWEHFGSSRQEGCWHLETRKAAEVPAVPRRALHSEE